MSAKEFLPQYMSSLRTIRQKDAELEQLRIQAEGVLGIKTAKVRRIEKNGNVVLRDEIVERVSSSYSGDRMADLIAEIVDLQVEVMNERTNAIQALKRVRNVINMVDNYARRDLLHRRYIEGQTWERIAVEMDKSYQYVAGSLHHKALKDVEKIIGMVDRS